MKLLELFNVIEGKYKRSQMYYLFMPNGGEDGVLVGWRGDWPESHRVEFRGPRYSQWTGDQGSDFERLHDSLEGWHSTVLHTNRVLDIHPGHPDYKNVRSAIEKGGSSVSEAIDPRQLVNVDTPQFHSWFGASKAVDDEGHPIVFFRGTAKVPGAEKFATRRTLPSFVASADIASVYSASYPKSMFGPAFGEEPPPPTFQSGATVSPVFLSIQKPVDLRGIEHLDFEMGLFGVLRSDWSNYDEFEMMLSMLNNLRNRENKGYQFEYNLPDLPGYLSTSDWTEVMEWLNDTWEEADAEEWSGNAAEMVTSVLAEIEVDVYAIVDTSSFARWAASKGFDGVVHDDVFAQGAKYVQSLLGKDVPNGLDAEDMHVTWRPFRAEQVKSIFNQGGWSQEPGSPMVDSIGEDTLELPDLEVGDELMVGKFKNRKATIGGFKKDKHNQPVAKTDKGDQQIFKGRVKKLMDEEMEDAGTYQRVVGIAEKIRDELVGEARLDELFDSSTSEIEVTDNNPGQSVKYVIDGVNWFAEFDEEDGNFAVIADLDAPKTIRQALRGFGFGFKWLEKQIKDGHIRTQVLIIPADARRERIFKPLIANLAKSTGWSLTVEPVFGTTMGYKLNSPDASGVVS